MLTQFTLQTERSTLRLLATGDTPTIQTVASVRKIADTTISIPHPYPDDPARQYVERQMTEFKAGQSVRFWFTFELDCWFVQL